MRRYARTLLFQSILPLMLGAAAQGQVTRTITCANVPAMSGEGKPVLADAAKSADAFQFQTAIDAYHGLIAKKIDVAYAYAGLTRVYLKQNDLAQAVAAAQAANAAAPGSLPAQVAMGEAYYRQGRIGDAELAFDAACGQDADALIGLARIYEITGNYLRASNAIESARKLAPNNPAIQFSWIYGSGNDARRAPMKAIRISSEEVAKNSDGAGSGPATPELAAVAQSAGADSEVTACRAVSKNYETQINMEAQFNDGPDHTTSGYTLKLNVDGATTHLQVDTGASGIFINHKTAEKAGIQPLSKEKIEGIGDKGPVDTYVGLAKSIKIGDIELQNCYVTVSEKRSVIAGSDGLLGVVVFEDYLVELNLPDGKFKLSKLPPLPDAPGQPAGSAQTEKFGLPQHNRYIAPELKGFTPVFRIGSDIVIPTAVNTHLNKLFLLDTGAFGDVISPAAAREVTSEGGTDEITVKGVSGSVKNVGTADRLTLTFAGMRQVRDETVSFGIDSISNSMGTEISGILGFDMLRYLDIKIDYRDALISFAYNPNRLYH